MNASHADSEAPNCWQCRHFSVSWDPNLPYACRLMGFKSRIMPAIEVLRADGLRCQGFSRKTSAGLSGVSDASGVHGNALVNDAAPGMPSTASTVSTASSTSGNGPRTNGLYSTFSKLA